MRVLYESCSVIKPDGKGFYNWLPKSFTKKGILMNSNDIEEIYNRLADTIYRMALVILKNTADAEDTVSEVFIRYLRKPQCFRDRDHEKAWFLRVTINYCRDQLRKRKYAAGDIETLSDQPVEDRDKYVLQEVMDLPDKYREVIYLHYYEGYTLKEIGKMTGTPVSTLQTRLVRARNQLKLRLEG